MKDFAELVGEEWERPRLSREEIARRQARCVALEAARDAYETWAFWKLQEMADEYQQLPADGEVAESAIRAVCQHPDWFSESKVEWWEKELARIYDRLPVLEYELDLLTFTMHERERFLWWLEETDHE